MGLTPSELLGLPTPERTFIFAAASELSRRQNQGGSGKTP